jgi:23S rRNA (guanosine2251-2'-O)-methyltransferase
MIIIAHNIRSTHNVGALLRTADGLGIEMVFLTGYTPYPKREHDGRLPHIAEKLTKQISKTALGAESSQAWKHYEELEPVISLLKNNGYSIGVLEQSKHSVSLPNFSPPAKFALILGSEVEGASQTILDSYPLHIEIPMAGAKESFNVVEAATMAMYHCMLYNHK